MILLDKALELWYNWYSRGSYMITEKDIDINVDYKELSFITGHLTHECKRMGKDEFVKCYSSKLDSLRKEYSELEFCFLLGYLGYLDSNFEYDSSVRMPKYILNQYDYLFFTEDGDMGCVRESFKVANKQLLSRGFVYDVIDEAI